MDSIIKDLKAIYIGLSVATFLRETNRAVKAIELCEECLILLLNNSEWLKEDRFKLLYSSIFKCLSHSYLWTHDFGKAEQCAQELLVMFQDSNDILEEGLWRELLATIYATQYKFTDAKESLLKALDIFKVTGDRIGQADVYHLLTFLTLIVGDFQRVTEYLEKSFHLAEETGDKKIEARFYSDLGSCLQRFKRNRMASELFQRAQKLRTEIGGREEFLADCRDQESFHSALGDHQKAAECLKKSITILEGDNYFVVFTIYFKLGHELLCLGKYSEAEKYLEAAHVYFFSKCGENIVKRLIVYDLVMVKFSLSKTQEAYRHLLQYIKSFESFRNVNKTNEQSSISLAEHGPAYKEFSTRLFHAGSPHKALSVEELGRARALVDLVAAKYFSGVNYISADLQSLCRIEKLINHESDSTYLYLSYHERSVRAAILKPRRNTYFAEEEEADIPTLIAENVVDLDDLFNKSFRSFGILPRELCEDRSLDDSEKRDDSFALFRGNETEDINRYLQMFYKLIVAPVANLLSGSEVIIVPERSLYRVPFAALYEETGKKFLSENLRIRIAPSLMTLKLIQDSPPNYHSATGALIVGDPVVGEVLYRGARKNITELPRARKEAEMVGRLMGVEPLIGERATKQAVLNGIKKVGLIHIAAHGSAERGEIALAPNCTTDSIGFPKEEDYLLTMEDISQVQLRAKLVVLSCCHSGKGRINHEGVVGIARAFLGSGARSVLVAGWAVEDTATEQLMKQFYTHLADGESAGESLHQAMKWMRNNNFTKVSQWAPFTLIGDDVKIDFVSEAKKTLPAKD